MTHEELEDLVTRIASLPKIREALADQDRKIEVQRRVKWRTSTLALGHVEAAAAIAAAPEHDAIDALKSYGIDDVVGVLANMPARDRLRFMDKITHIPDLDLRIRLSDPNNLPKVYVLSLEPGRGWSRGTVEVSGRDAARLESAGFPVRRSYVKPRWPLISFTINGTVTLTERQLRLAREIDAELDQAIRSGMVRDELMSVDERRSWAIMHARDVEWPEEPVVNDDDARWHDYKLPSRPQVSK